MTDQDKIAQMNCAAHYMITEIIWDLLDNTDVELIREIMTEVDKNMDEGLPWYQAFEGIKPLQTYLPIAITEEHSGDCVKMPMTCMRCLAEEYYEVESTVPR